MRSENDELRTKLNNETARVRWHELQRHFAMGAVVTVDASEDLIEVAISMASDDTARIEHLLRDDRIRRTNADEANEWTRVDQELWCVVVAPWVLVQAVGARA